MSLSVSPSEASGPPSATSLAHPDDRLSLTPTGSVGTPEQLLAPPRPPRLNRSRRREIVAVLEPTWADGDDATASVRAPAELVADAARRLTVFLSPGELVVPMPDGRLALRLRHEDRAARPVRLQQMAYHALEVLDSLGFRAGVVDLGVGWAPVGRQRDPEAALRQAAQAAEESVRQRDLQPRLTADAARRRTPSISRWSASRQVLLATVGSIALPFLGLVALHSVGLDVADGLYWVLVAALLMTAGGIWAEASAAFRPITPPATDRPAPRASAVIAAYLPNEADTVLETLEVFRSHAYSGGLQVVLAYNTPTPMAVEAELAALAEGDPDLVVLKVPDSTSKAQNVNAALRVADGEFVGIFDADHHPAPGSFDRAWRWLADDADVVQGHCVIRNGEENRLTRLVAVEFEQIYAVAHPGRARVHGFGIFGGSNGYWRASALERIRLRGSFLTEDIEASMRVLAAGGRIVNDPGLVSRELAPTTLGALWKQRMRWAQGWFQVSCRHLSALLRAPDLTLRQKAGATYLLAWREVYPWIALMSWPLLGFLVWRDGGLDLTSPLFGLVTLYVLASGPLQTAAAYRLAAPEVRRHPRWFLSALVLNLVFYTELKNLVNRVAHLKQLRGEHQWVVTPRTAPTGGKEAVA
ncbi:glycosyltransferase family 2 protein [Nocardioides zeae]|uniref:Glycosyltransferase family 2 protein n=1 Tax=Nocardioides imazamoxiresistens TaxID=3231893 RepID=A0ABU3PVB5_9ACTN|nr:glycosyltransferase family 2 protein [Nocardioides zeae]MDT9593184.1 glycosyltransferase family 2 protein [Nocardioides zeae]